ncbi:hypothetical protein [Yersinia aldovae]|uniref:Uncharacterized protein n=1 Tax=Yersinia aldovae TaxID=29483 RepID=A0A0T9TQC5_YERAL|nr:hypothetical protein [Yersinia aldovae]CNK95676.1 Uncharacterised protein [Yersinia aldovae]CNL00874.1 Uncharacterised protein [Yersinia aldovae]
MFFKAYTAPTISHNRRSTEGQKTSESLKERVNSVTNRFGTQFAGINQGRQLTKPGTITSQFLKTTSEAKQIKPNEYLKLNAQGNFYAGLIKIIHTPLTR